jgi:hypothetical protein
VLSVLTAKKITIIKIFLKKEYIKLTKYTILFLIMVKYIILNKILLFTNKFVSIFYKIELFKIDNAQLEKDHLIKKLFKILD